MRSVFASQFAFESNQLLKSVVLVQVFQVLWPLSGLAGMLLEICLIWYLSLCFCLFLILMYYVIVVMFNGLLIINVFLWYLLRLRLLHLLQRLGVRDLSSGTLWSRQGELLRWAAQALQVLAVRRDIIVGVATSLFESVWNSILLFLLVNLGL